MAVKAKTKFPTEKQLGFRPFILPTSKLAPVKQIFAGYEIEKKFVLMTVEEDHSKRKNSLNLYNTVLTEGVMIEQGYVKDIPKAAELLKKLGIQLNDFKPNTIRLRKFGIGYKTNKISPYKYVLTLKDRKESKRREVEFRLTPELFKKYWPWTEGSRLTKKRMLKQMKGHTFEIDAFTDRILLLAECEVTNEKDLEKVPTLGMDVTSDKNWSNKALSR